MTEGVWDSRNLIPEQTQEEKETAKTPPQIVEEKLVRQIMQHDKGNISIVKPIIISTEPSNDMIKSISEAPYMNPISSSMANDSTIMEIVINPGILASSSSQGKQFIMLENTPDLEFLSYNQRQQTMVKQRKRKRMSISSQVQEKIVEEPILHLKMTKLTDLVQARIVFN